MKVVNKHPNYIRKIDRVKQLNDAYAVVFLSINKIDTDIKSTSYSSNKK